MTFQDKIKPLTFKTFYQNQTQQVDYDRLFADKRVLVFSVPVMLGNFSNKHLKSFHNGYQELTGLGLDDVYCVSSSDLLIAPWADKHSGVVMGLPDSTHELVKAVSDYYNYEKSISQLISFWQYIIIINDGQPEKFWQNPVKTDMSWEVFKNRKYSYHGLTVEKVKKYLVDNKSNI